MSYQQVGIIDDNGNVDADRVTVNRYKGDEVEWVSSGGPATILFDSSPFGHKVFNVPAGGAVFSGPVTAPKGEYKYTVKGARGENDPVVVVDP